MFANYDKRIVPGRRRLNPLLVSIDDRQREAGTVVASR
jgi:hypothetical protein